MRLTPTCVGTTYGMRPATAALPAHPHVRGDDGVTLAWRASVVGLTPTCVGTTRLHAAFVVAASGSPPRAWGRRPVETPPEAADAGSPPRAWGGLVLHPV